MIDCFMQELNGKLENSDRFNVYRSFKDLLQAEKYLVDIAIPKFRFSFTKFRLGINDLRPNKNYYYKDKGVDCPFCDEIENEIHFLLRCPKYAHLREKYINKHFKNSYNPPLPFLLQNDDKYVTRDVAMFVHYAFCFREEMISCLNS